MAAHPGEEASIVCGNVEFSVDNTQKYVPGHMVFSGALAVARAIVLAFVHACPFSLGRLRSARRAG